MNSAPLSVWTIRIGNGALLTCFSYREICDAYSDMSAKGLSPCVSVRARPLVPQQQVSGIPLRIAHDLRLLLLRLPAGYAVGARLRSFRLSSVPSYRFFHLYTVLRLPLCRIAAFVTLFFRSPVTCLLCLNTVADPCAVISPAAQSVFPLPPPPRRSPCRSHVCAPPAGRCARNARVRRSPAPRRSAACRPRAGRRAAACCPC